MSDPRNLDKIDQDFRRMKNKSKDYEQAKEPLKDETSEILESHWKEKKPEDNK